MISAVNNSAPAQTTVQVKTASQAVTSQPATPVASAPQAAPSDTVKISAAQQILQESIENPAQTAKEAAGGDAQARRLLAREAAQHASVK